MVGFKRPGSGPRREDVAARRVIESNWGTIERIADQISDGGYSARRRAAATPSEPQPSGKLICDMGAPRRSPEPEPYVRISPNRRVVAADAETGRQLHHLGAIRRVGGTWRFLVATKANGFFAPVEAAIAERLLALDGVEMGNGRDDAKLAAEIAECLGYSRA